MVTQKKCDAAALKGGDRAYVTNNPANSSCVYCCKKDTFSANQCSYIEAFLYKRHGVDTFESTAGDVSHCVYESQNCALKDGSMLMRTTNESDNCEYTPSFNVDGEFIGTHFVSKERDLALTFYNHGIDTYKDCNNTWITRSDQRLMVCFMTLLKNVIINETMEKGDRIKGLEGAAVVMLAIKYSLQLAYRNS